MSSSITRGHCRERAIYHDARELHVSFSESGSFFDQARRRGTCGGQCRNDGDARSGGDRFISHCFVDAQYTHSCGLARVTRVLRDRRAGEHDGVDASGFGRLDEPDYALAH